MNLNFAEKLEAFTKSWKFHLGMDGKEGGLRYWMACFRASFRGCAHASSWREKVKIVEYTQATVDPGKHVLFLPFQS